MTATDCQHQDAAETGRVCSHLVDAPDLNYIDYNRRFTGNGSEYSLLCFQRCRADVAEASLRVVCADCFRRIETASSWEGTLGRPEVLVRASNLAFEHETVHLAGIEGSTLLDIQPVNGASRSVWVALTGAGELVRLDLTEGTATSLARLPESPVILDQPISLHVSGNGEFAAIVNTRGETGLVVDLRAGAVTMLLDREVHRTAQSTFSLAFFERDGRPLLIHATPGSVLTFLTRRPGAC